MKISYKQIRTLYYFGIFVLAIYAMPKVQLFQEYIYPILNTEIINGVPIISAIAIATLVCAYMAFKYRKIG